MMEFQNGPSRIKAKAIFRHNSRPPALLNFYGKEKYIKIDDCRKILKGLFLYGKDTTRAENRANELYKGDSWFGSESEQTWKKCSDSKRKQRRVSER
jgi:hypothetical protein